MFKDDCIALAERIGCKPADIAAFYWGEGSEDEAEINESGDSNAAEAALAKFFGPEFIDLVEGLESLPGMFDHVIVFVMTGHIMEYSGGRHLSRLQAHAYELVQQCRAKYIA